MISDRFCNFWKKHYGHTNGPTDQKRTNQPTNQSTIQPTNQPIDISSQRGKKHAVKQLFFRGKLAFLQEHRWSSWQPAWANPKSTKGNYLHPVYLNANFFMWDFQIQGFEHRFAKKNPKNYRYRIWASRTVLARNSLFKRGWFAVPPWRIWMFYKWSYVIKMVTVSYYEWFIGIAKFWL